MVPHAGITQDTPGDKPCENSYPIQLGPYVWPSPYRVALGRVAQGSSRRREMMAFPQLGAGI